MRKSVLSLAASLLMLAPSIALADATGTALGVDPDAEAKRGKDTQVLIVGADIFIGDIVRTGPSGQVQIKFSDNTELVVGPRSALTIEDYLLREDGSAGKLAVNTLAGTFRFVTGGAPKDRYLIKTPTGTIGVRGTAFDWSNGEWGTKVMLYHGAIEVCTTGGTCVLLEDVCNVAEYDDSTARVIGHFDTITGPNRNAFRGLFRYAVDQRPLLREFRINGVERCVNRPTTSSAPGSLSTPGSGGGGPRPTTTPTVDPNPTPGTPANDNPPPTGGNNGGGNGGNGGSGGGGSGGGGGGSGGGGGGNGGGGGGSTGGSGGGRDDDDDDYRGIDGGNPFGGKGPSLSFAG